MSTQTYDIIVMLGVVALVAIIIFWSVNYGASVVSDLLNEAPIVLQSSFASYAAGSCSVDGNITIAHELVKRYPLYAFMNATHVWIRASDSRYYGDSETERGGYIGFVTKAASPFVTCGIDVTRKNVLFNENLHHYITLNKTENSMQIGVR